MGDGSIQSGVCKLAAHKPNACGAVPHASNTTDCSNGPAACSRHPFPKKFSLAALDVRKVGGIHLASTLLGRLSKQNSRAFLFSGGVVYFWMTVHPIRCCKHSARKPSACRAVPHVHATRRRMLACFERAAHKPSACRTVPRKPNAYRAVSHDHAIPGRMLRTQLTAATGPPHVHVTLSLKKFLSQH